MEAGVAGYVTAGWEPARGTPAAAAGFARTVVTAAGPGDRDRAKCLLWAASRLAGYGISAGLEPVPEVLLHPSVIERFAAHAPGMSGAARRTLRTNLRFLARRVMPHLDPADAPLPRERASTGTALGRAPRTSTTTSPERAITSVPRALRRSERISPAPAPRHTSADARERRPGAG